MCVALVALDATLVVARADGTRQIPFDDFHLLPGETPERETVLARDELIVALELPPLAPGRSRYRKVRDRASYAFALVSVAAHLVVEDGIIADVRLALGGVAHRPWRARLAEGALRGGPPSPDAFTRAAEAELAAARGLRYNSFKIELARRVLVDVLSELAGER